MVLSLCKHGFYEKNVTRHGVVCLLPASCSQTTRRGYPKHTGRPIRGTTELLAEGYAETRRRRGASGGAYHSPVRCRAPFLWPTALSGHARSILTSRGYC